MFQGEYKFTRGQIKGQLETYRKQDPQNYKQLAIENLRYKQIQAGKVGKKANLKVVAEEKKKAKMIEIEAKDAKI